ncbi:hypothetical protein H6503_01760 [Candidatus Woesearchaeota archaeon]|nr:hypothetical protein [Candidatus Woesearchaeota archaeon]
MLNKKAALSRENVIMLLIVLAVVAILLFYLYEPVKNALLNSLDLL